MKLISLNIWGGRLHKDLMEFFFKYQDTDVFCLQEVYKNAVRKETIFSEGTNLNVFSDIQRSLPNHLGFYHPHLENWWGLAMFVKNSTPVNEVSEQFVHLQKGYNIMEEKKGYTAKNIQYLQTNIKNKPLTVINFHGLWNGLGKGDSPDRIRQSKRIINFLETLNNELVMCGDFNLLPETKSLRMIEKNVGLRNLVREYGITSTRTSYYTKPNKFADYIFVSQNVDISNFEVLKEEVTDHSALLIELA